MIALIGAPGSGKSTVGALLAQRLGEEFVDVDALIEQAEGRDIPEIFLAEGSRIFARSRDERRLQPLSAAAWCPWVGVLRLTSRSVRLWIKCALSGWTSRLVLPQIESGSRTPAVPCWEARCIRSWCAS